MCKYIQILSAYWLGIKDGFSSPIDLSMGMTFSGNDFSKKLNLAYDHGANLGQLIGKIFKRRQ